MKKELKKRYENGKFFTRNCIQVAINTEEKSQTLTATKFIRSLKRYNPQWSLWGKRLFLLHFYVYLSVCNALWINLTTHHNLYKLTKHVNKILYPQFFSHCSLSKKFCRSISFFNASLISSMLVLWFAYVMLGSFKPLASIDKF